MRQRQINRKSAPRVVGGRVQKKNDPEWTANYYTTAPASLVIDRRRPGQGCRHVLMQRDVERFVRLLPDWPELSRSLNAIALAPGEHSTNGSHTPGVVHICAWEADLWINYAVGHYEDHNLHILLRELGHRHDRMTTESKVRAAQGEPYAESYALAYEVQIWDRYQEAFGW